MSGFRQRVALSDHWIARAARGLRRAVVSFTLPAPAFVVKPILAAFITARAIYYFLVRVFVCEPLFKAYCFRYGRGVRTGVYVHWVSGNGKLIIGDNVLVDGKCSFSFATRYASDPVLTIGNNTIIGHGCSFTVGRQITVGPHCMFAVGVHVFDAPGHPTDPVLRRTGAPANSEDVRPIEIQENVWIGRNATVFPGVTVGEGSVIVTGTMVTNDVPPYTIVAGNPGRVIGHLPGGAAPAAAGNGYKPGVPADAALEVVMAVLRNVLDTEDLQPDDDFYDAGLTSIMVLPLLVEIEQRLGVSLSQEDLEARTGQQLAARVSGISLSSRRV